MKLHPRYRPELCASEDLTQLHLNEPHLDVDSETITATDGHMIVRVPVDVDPGDTTGSLPRLAMPHARTDDGVRARRQLVGGKQGPWFKRSPGINFPPTAPLFDNALAIDQSGTVSIGFNANLLLRLARALGAGYQGKKKAARYPFVVLTFTPGKPGESPIDPITVRTIDGRSSKIVDAEAIGILMPARFR